jgi:prophage DNA circulation protein
MSWREHLLSASYRGVHFKIKSGTYEAGRRTEIKQFPNNDAPVIQDFGADATSITIDAFIISNKDNDFDYMKERDALIVAFSDFNPAVNKNGFDLIHPYYGTIIVYPQGKISIAESTEEGGMCRVTMSFVRVFEETLNLILPSFKNSGPQDSEDRNAAVDNAVALADADVLSNFNSLFKTGRAFADKLEYIINSNLQKIQQMVFKIKGGISSLMSEGVGLISSAASTLNNIIDSPESLFTTIKALADSIQIICGSGDTISGEVGKSSISGMLDIVNSITEPISFVPDSQLNNIIVSNDLYKYALIASAMQIAIRTDFLDKEEAITYADLVASAIEDFLERLGAEIDMAGYDYVEGDYLDNSLLFSAMEDLRNIFIQAMYAKAETISTLIEYLVPTETQSILELAFDKYENLDREDEIYDMNMLDIRHPGFMPNGKTVRILNE